MFRNYLLMAIVSLGVLAGCNTKSEPQVNANLPETVSRGAELRASSSEPLSLPQLSLGERPGAGLMSDAMLDFALFGKDVFHAATLELRARGTARLDDDFWSAGLILTRPVSAQDHLPLPWVSAAESNQPTQSLAWSMDDTGMTFDCSSTTFMGPDTPRATGQYSWETLRQGNEHFRSELASRQGADYILRSRLPQDDPSGRIYREEVLNYWEQCLVGRVVDYAAEFQAEPASFDALLLAQGVALAPSTGELPASWESWQPATDTLLVLYSPATAVVEVVRRLTTGGRADFRGMRLNLGPEALSDGAIEIEHIQGAPNLMPSQVIRSWAVPSLE